MYCKNKQSYQTFCRVGCIVTSTLRIVCPCSVLLHRLEYVYTEYIQRSSVTVMYYDPIKSTTDIHQQTHYSTGCPIYYGWLSRLSNMKKTLYRNCVESVTNENKLRFRYVWHGRKIYIKGAFWRTQYYQKHMLLNQKNIYN